VVEFKPLFQSGSTQSLLYSPAKFSSRCDHLVSASPAFACESISSCSLAAVLFPSDARKFESQGRPQRRPRRAVSQIPAASFEWRPATAAAAAAVSAPRLKDPLPPPCKTENSVLGFSAQPSTRRSDGLTFKSTCDQQLAAVRIRHHSLQHTSLWIQQALMDPQAFPACCV
jgi:hypothetical protein